MKDGTVQQREIHKKVSSVVATFNGSLVVLER